MESLHEPLATVWPAVTEAMYLLGRIWGGPDALWELLDAAPIDFLPIDRSDAPRLRELMNKYRDLPMDLADAAIVCGAERNKLSKVFTLDRRGFGVYRPRGVGKFTIVP
jgi:predicted nucleic acid-binding protein